MKNTTVFALAALLALTAQSASASGRILLAPGGTKSDAPAKAKSCATLSDKDVATFNKKYGTDHATACFDLGESAPQCSLRFGRPSSCRPVPYFHCSILIASLVAASS